VVVTASAHRAAAPPAAGIRVAVIAVSDTRTLQTDLGGALAQTLTEQAGFQVTARELVADEPARITALVRERLAAGRTDVVLLTGGTGVSPRDGTIEAVAPLLDRRLDGFGELFRMLSFAAIGPAAMLSRALAGSAGQVAIFVLPGSPAAVELALTRLILPELTHLVAQLRGPAGTKIGADTSAEHPHHVGRAHS
jgi:molybdenum cofactor biosynthesis protein B